MVSVIDVMFILFIIYCVKKNVFFLIVMIVVLVIIVFVLCFVVLSCSMLINEVLLSLLYDVMLKN